MIAMSEYICPTHGLIEGTECVRCLASRRKELQRLGLIAVFNYEEGPGPRPTDPSPLQIRFRAWKIRKRAELLRNKEYEKKPKRFWRVKPRIPKVVERKQK